MSISGNKIIEMVPSSLTEFFKGEGFDLQEGNANIRGAIKLHVICNRDSSVRWMYPASSGEPLFLQFYNLHGYLLHVKAWLVHTLFRLRIHSFISQKIFTLIPFSHNLHTSWIASANWAVFTGTRGTNRKIVFVKQNENGILSYIKIAIGAIAAAALKRESDTLRDLSLHAFQYVEFPKLLTTLNGMEVSSVENGHRQDELVSNHFDGIKEWSGISESSELPDETLYRQQISKNIVSILHANDQRIPRRLTSKLIKLFSVSRTYTPAYFTWSHGDFTPWNMYITKKGIGLYDLEQAAVRSAGYDLFHFVMQTGILQKREPYKIIRGRIEELMKHEYWKDHGIDNPEFYYQSYLLGQVSYYLLQYSQEPEWHVQTNWLLHTWEQAIDEELASLTPGSHREKIAEELFEFIKDHKAAVLKFRWNSIGDLPEFSDLDLLIDKNVIPRLIHLIKQHPLVIKATVFKKSYMQTVELWLRDGSYLSLDLIHDFKWKSLQFMKVEEALSRSLLVFETKKTDMRDDFWYCIHFYQLNNEGISLKYRSYFKSLSASEGMAIIREIEKRYKIVLQDLKSLFQPIPSLKVAIIRELKSHEANSGTKGVLRKWNYVLDTVRDKFFRHGMVFTISGVDGAGKSTVIDQLKQMLEERYRKQVMVLRHRPSILPILSSYKYGKTQAEHRTTTTLPRQGNNTNKISSMLRFAYYFTDYFFGQCYIWLRYTIRGKIVIYDRYYFDFMFDAKRSNIELPAAIAKFFYALILKPKLNFFLYAKPEVIRQRKTELASEVIDELTQTYLKQFQKLETASHHSRYIAIENTNLDNTLRLIIDEYKHAV